MKGPGPLDPQAAQNTSENRPRGKKSFFMTNAQPRSRLLLEWDEHHFTYISVRKPGLLTVNTDAAGKLPGESYGYTAYAAFRSELHPLATEDFSHFARQHL